MGSLHRHSGLLASCLVVSEHRKEGKWGRLGTPYPTHSNTFHLCGWPLDLHCLPWTERNYAQTVLIIVFSQWITFTCGAMSIAYKRPEEWRGGRSGFLISMCITSEPFCGITCVDVCSIDRSGVKHLNIAFRCFWCKWKQINIYFWSEKT